MIILFSDLGNHMLPTFLQKISYNGISGILNRNVLSDTKENVLPVPVKCINGPGKGQRNTDSKGKKPSGC